jgi:hypothetical protein
MGFPLPADKIAQTEEALGVAFPFGYLSRLRRDNGGEVLVDGEVWWLFPFRDDSDRKRLARSCNDVVRETKQLREWDGFPAAAVAIAKDGAGNALVLLPREDQPARLDEAVYDWFHETGELTRVADRFEELE